MDSSLVSINEEISYLSLEERVRFLRNFLGSEVALSSSFGKDSSILLSLFTNIHPNLPVIYIDHGCWPDRNTQQIFVDFCRTQYKSNLITFKPREKITYSEVYEALTNRNLEKLNLLKYIGKIEPLKRAVDLLGVKVLTTGISKDETVERTGFDFFMQTEKEYRFNPLLDWTKKMKSDYILNNSLPSNDAYFDIFKGLGGKDECGIHTFLGKDI